MHYQCTIFFPRYNIIEWPASRYEYELKEKGKYIRKRDWICMPGGGNLGDEYPCSERIRRTVIKQFPNNRIIIFPQTIFFTDTEQGNREKEITREIYTAHDKLLLLVRDEKSYEFAKEIYDGRIQLIPDIVLFSDYQQPCAKKEKELFCVFEVTKKAICQWKIKNKWNRS